MMYGEFTDMCAWYYRLTERLKEQEERFQNLLANALPYTGQTELIELDRIIRYNRKVQAALADTEKTSAQIVDAESIIYKMIEYFGIKPNTRLKGQIPEQLEFEFWLDESNQLHIQKLSDLAKSEAPPGSHYIYINSEEREEQEMEDDW